MPMGNDVLSREICCFLRHRAQTFAVVDIADEWSTSFRSMVYVNSMLTSWQSSEGEGKTDGQSGRQRVVLDGGQL